MWPSFCLHQSHYCRVTDDETPVSLRLKRNTFLRAMMWDLMCLSCPPPPPSLWPTFRFVGLPSTPLHQTDGIVEMDIHQGDNLDNDRLHILDVDQGHSADSYPLQTPIHVAPDFGQLSPFIRRTSGVVEARVDRRCREQVLRQLFLGDGEDRSLLLISSRLISSLAASI